MNGASVTRRSTGILLASSERAISITLFAPWECPTKTSGPALPAARSFTMSLTAVDHCTCPATSALMPLALSSLARLSMPVENTPNQPRSRSTRGSAASAQLHHSRAMATARQLAPRRKRNASRCSCARTAASGPRCPRRVHAIILAIAPCRFAAGTPLCHMSDVCPIRAGLGSCRTWFLPDLAGSSPDPLLPVVFFRIIARLRLDTRTQQTLMPLVLLLPLVSLAIYLIPIYLLRRKAYARAQ